MPQYIRYARTQRYTAVRFKMGRKRGIANRGVVPRFDEGKQRTEKAVKLSAMDVKLLEIFSCGQRLGSPKAKLLTIFRES